MQNSPRPSTVCPSQNVAAEHLADPKAKGRPEKTIFSKESDGPAKNDGSTSQHRNPRDQLPWTSRGARVDTDGTQWFNNNLTGEASPFKFKVGDRLRPMRKGSRSLVF